MTFGTSIVLLAVGAILRFAVETTTRGFNIHTVGVILMIAGGVGLVLSFLWVAIWADRRQGRPALPEERREYDRRRESY
jgi:hypothetical protein